MNYPKPAGYYANTENEPLFFHLLNVSEGLMILVIFPDETTMLYDCNVRQGDKDRIIGYLGKHIPYRYDSEEGEESQWIDVFVNSHRDRDHYRGLKEIHAKYKIKSIWDSGQTGEAAEDKDYQYYMRLRRSLIDKYGDNAVKVPVPSRYPVISYKSADVYCLCSSQEINEEIGIQDFSEAILKEAKIQHKNSIVLSIQYSGRSILLPSDSDWKAWKEKIVPNFGDSGLLNTNILVASHHGSRSFFTAEEENEHIDPEENPHTTYIESIDYIKPSITLISCGEYDQFHHPNSEALEIYEKNTVYPEKKQVYTTNQKGSYVGFIDTFGNWTVAPVRFYPKSNTGASFDIKCVVNHNENRYLGSSGGNFPIGCDLEFSVSPHGGLIDPYRSVKVWWEVSNGGINNDHEHQDNYKGKDEKGGKLEFYRDVAYEGKHLLRCRVKNKKKRFDVTKLFIVNGVHT